MAKPAPSKGKTREAAPLAHVRVHKHTSIGGGILKVSSMNKSRKRSYKKYRGQGR